METTQRIPEWRTTADDIWVVLKETDRIVRENAKGFEELRKAQAETGKQIEETGKQIEETGKQIEETGKQMKETDKRLGKLSSRYGEMVEHMVVPNLITKFNKLKLSFTRAHRNTEVKDYVNDIFAEVDVFLENGDRVMIVEIKSKPDIHDINEHIERMENLRKYADLHDDARKYMGAVGGMVFGEDEKKYALKKGFYVIEPSGETFNIIPPYGAPREW
ncbi:MAG: hypothetical protein LBO04_01755 [Spirochaetaceae bacterium]|jgi:chromosome segregation ATPase|nr:hypothetical protein [Spirochaetaceae bacterium]